MEEDEDDVEEDEDDDNDDPVDELIMLERIRSKEKKMAKLFSKLYPEGRRVMLWQQGCVVNCHIEGEEPTVIII